MASSHTNLDAAATQPIAPLSTVLVCVTSLPIDAFEATLTNLAQAFPDRSVLVATPDAASTTSPSSLPLLPYTAIAPSASSEWIQTAANYLQTLRLAQENNATACVLLGGECQSIHPEAISSLSNAITDSGADLAIARYSLGPREGLVNSAILYPISYALFNAAARFPLAIDLALSPRMTERLSVAALKCTANNQNDDFLWPVTEAAIANFKIAEVEIPSRIIPQPIVADLNSLLAQIAGSLFASVDANATFWQRSRGTPPIRSTVDSPPSSPSTHTEDITPMIEAFHLAYTNLHEIWSLVLPPNSLLGLKKLAVLPAANFQMPDTLWARIIYDFALAYRLRTINRGHLLGALTPLYLAWVASHLTLVNNGTAPERHIQDLATVFQTDKSYLVSRWRWPDRFNP